MSSQKESLKEVPKTKRRRRKEGRTMGGKKRKPLQVYSSKPSADRRDSSSREECQGQRCDRPAVVPKEMVHETRPATGRIRARPGWANDFNSEKSNKTSVCEECGATFHCELALGSHRAQKGHCLQKESRSTWANPDLSAAACAEHIVKEEVNEELISPPSTFEDICSPRGGCGDGSINGQLNLTASPAGSRRLPSPSASIGGSLWGEIDSGDVDFIAEAGASGVAGLDSKARLQFVAREGESLGQILHQVGPS